METSLTLYIAWTIDDGPSEFTDQLIDSLLHFNISAVTWFCSRCNVMQYKDTTFQRMKHLGEIAVHEIHPSQFGYNWFPRRGGACFESIEQALTELRQYLQELEQLGVKPKFVRLPGGEFSELRAYLHYRGILENTDRIARAIIDNNPVPPDSQIIADEWKYFNMQLAQLGLIIWSGASGSSPLLGGKPYHHNSWQAEAAGIAEGRGANNITLHDAPARKRINIQEVNNGLFERECTRIMHTHQSSSLVVLTHDTFREDVEEIIAHIVEMNNYIEDNNFPIRLRYVSLSDLYALIRD